MSYSHPSSLQMLSVAVEVVVGCNTLVVEADSILIYYQI